MFVLKSIDPLQEESLSSSIIGEYRTFEEAIEPVKLLWSDPLVRANVYLILNQQLQKVVATIFAGQKDEMIITGIIKSI